MSNRENTLKRVPQRVKFKVLERIDDSLEQRYVIVQLSAGASTYLVACDDLFEMQIDSEVCHAIRWGDRDQGVVELGAGLHPNNLSFIAGAFACDLAAAELVKYEIWDTDHILKRERFEELLRLEEAPFGFPFDTLKILMVRAVLNREINRVQSENGAQPSEGLSTEDLERYAKLTYVYTREFCEFSSIEQLAAACILSYVNSDLNSTGFYASQFIHAYLAGRDTKRGRKVRDGASTGGLNRGQQMRARTKQVIEEMERLIATGLSRKSAAQIASNKGFGTSGVANRAAWYRSGRNTKL